MSLACVQSCALDGLNAPTVTVEAHLANGLPSFTLVGLAEAEVREARERVRAALQTCLFEWPTRRITVNLAPADIPKESGRFDLPIALAILAASGQISNAALNQFVFAGELSLTGELRSIRGALAMVAGACQAGNSKPFILPIESALEAVRVKQADIYGALTLPDVVKFINTYDSHNKNNNINDNNDTHNTLNDLNHHVLKHVSELAKQAVLFETASKRTVYPDLSDVKGQAQAKRALEIAAAGGHGLLLIGPPGTGKSMLAQRFAGLLPPMSDDEAIESAAVLSISGQFDPALFGQRVLRSPHHTASGVALVGGGSVPRPGEVSLAHHGVLFLDELPEFERGVLEVLREPLETGKITISRATRRADFPARFQLIAAMNPCPCGYLGHLVRPCRCTTDQVLRYQSKISGPLLDRIDMHIVVPALAEGELLAPSISNKDINHDIDHTKQQGISMYGETSAVVATRVQQARERAYIRQGCANALLQGRSLDEHCALDETARTLLQVAMTKLGLSARATHRVLRLARTLADLAQRDSIQSQDIAEAIQYRRGLKTGA